MYEVLLVDDEVYVTKSLRFSIAWQALQMSVFAEVHSGSEALEIMRHHAVDIVITDIRMPGMDGLQLCKAIRAMNPKTQIIIISGYADFTYAQQCIACGVKGYCLKPIDAADLTVCLRQALRALQESGEIMRKELVESMENDDIPALKAHLAHSPLGAEPFYVAVSVGAPRFTNLIPASLVIKLGAANDVYLSSAPLDFTGLLHSDALYGIGVATHAVDCASLRKTIGRCTQRAYQYFVFEKSGVWNQIPPDSAAQKGIQNLTAALDANNLAQAEHLVQDMATSAQAQAMFNIKSAYFLFGAIMSNETLQEKLCLGDLNDFRQLAAEFGTFEKMLLQILELFHTPADMANENFGSAILSILQYIQQNFTRDISLQSISDTLHLSRGYVGQLFKKETGNSYSRYLTNLRVERAKETLLQTTLSVSEVGEAAGFNDYFYFIKTFKKEVGCTPSQFRYQKSQNENRTIEQKHSLISTCETHV
ncbi:MAG: response regulator [Ruthenibacterium sp.]